MSLLASAAFNANATVGRDTPESIPDVFGQSQSPVGGGFGGGGGGFRIAGAGGLANIVNILGASGIRFQTADDDEDGELHIVDSSSGEGLVLSEDGHGAKLDLVDDDGDSHMDSGEDSDATAAATEPTSNANANVAASSSSGGAQASKTETSPSPASASKGSEAKD